MYLLSGAKDCENFMSTTIEYNSLDCINNTNQEENILDDYVIISSTEDQR